MKAEKLTEDQSKLLMEIFALGHLINQETTYCVFMDYSGHVYSMGVRICESKSNYNTEALETQVQSAFLEYHDKDPKNRLNWFKAKRDVMKEILETEDIPYHTLTEHIEEVRSYSF